MRLFQRNTSKHQRLESGDFGLEPAPGQFPNMQAVEVNVMVPKGQVLGCEIDSLSNHVISVTKGSLAAAKDIRVGDLVVQVNGTGTEVKKAEDLIALDEAISLTLLRKRRASSASYIPSESHEWGASKGKQDDQVAKEGKLKDDDKHAE